MLLTPSLHVIGCALLARPEGDSSIGTHRDCSDLLKILLKSNYLGESAREYLMSSRKPTRRNSVLLATECPVFPLYQQHMNAIAVL